VRLREYARALRRRAWIPVVLVFAAVVTAGGLSLLARSTYTGTAAVFAAAPTGTTRTVTFQQTVTSNTLAVAVIQKLGLNDSPDTLVQQIQVRFAGSNLYRVSVTRFNARDAAVVANEVANQAVALYRRYATQAAPDDPSLAKLRQKLHDDYAKALTARLNFQAAHPGAIALPNSTPRDVGAAAQLLQLQLEEDAAAQAYRNVLGQSNKVQLDQFSQAGDFNAFVLDQAVAKRDSGAQVRDTLIATGLAIVLGVGFVILLEHLDNKWPQRPEAAEEVIGAPVIGIIPKATPQGLRSGKGPAG
jgi:capsular polysaccharide biosynthesis protein